MSETTTVREYGVRYPNGFEDWNTAASWGTIDSPEMRASFQEQNRIRLEAFGLPPMEVRFFQRDVTTTIENLQEVDDTVPPAAPPAAEDETEATDDSNAEHPAGEPAAEGESPVETDSPVTEENHGTAG